MRPEIIKADFLELDGNNGSTFVPLDDVLSASDAALVRRELVGGLPGADIDQFAPEPFRSIVAELLKFYDGSKLERITLHVQAIGARLTMPGYMDCTDWTLHETEEEAREALTDLYGDEA